MIEQTTFSHRTTQKVTTAGRPAQAMRRLALLLFLTPIPLTACGDDTGGSSDGSGGNGADGEKCYNVDVNTLDGGQACGPQTCSAGEYCASDVGICDPGCLVASTCPKGFFCDASTPGNVGTCREPGPEQEVACPDSTDTGAGTGTGTIDCASACSGKVTACGGSTIVCPGICQQATEEQLECLQAASCEDFADGEECGFSFAAD